MQGDPSFDGWSKHIRLASLLRVCRLLGGLLLRRVVNDDLGLFLHPFTNELLIKLLLVVLGQLALITPE